MRKRFPISTHFEFKEALTAKMTLKKHDESQDPPIQKAYQIRKYANGFRLVERLNSKEAQVIQELRNGTSKRRAKKRRSTPIL